MGDAQRGNWDYETVPSPGERAIMAPQGKLPHHTAACSMRIRDASSLTEEIVRLIVDERAFGNRVLMAI